MRRGIEAPDLHPEAIFPGSFLPHSGSLPRFWRWIRSFPPSPHGRTTQPWAAPVQGAKTRAGLRVDKGSLAVAQVPCRHQQPERAIELQA